MISAEHGEDRVAGRRHQERSVFERALCAQLLLGLVCRRPAPSISSGAADTNETAPRKTHATPTSNPPRPRMILTQVPPIGRA